MRALFPKTGFSYPDPVFRPHQRPRTFPRQTVKRHDAPETAETDISANRMIVLFPFH